MVALPVTGAKLVAEVYPACSGSLVEGELPMFGERGTADPVPGSPAAERQRLQIPFDPNVERLELGSAEPTSTSRRPAYQLLFDPVATRLFDEPITRYDNTRVVWKEIDRDGRSTTCGSVSLVALGIVYGKPTAEPGQAAFPRRLSLLHLPETDTYFVLQKLTEGGWPSAHAMFRIDPGSARHLQRERLFTRYRLPSLALVLGLAALLAALLRSRGVSRALRFDRWTEARLTAKGIVESDGGSPVGTLEGSPTGSMSPGPILVAPDALTSGTLYRDMPIIPRGSITPGTKADWLGVATARGRQARALAIASTACTVLAILGSTRSG